jgi:Ser/Thr protein kinase RdoA (MazF antagonist)
MGTRRVVSDWPPLTVAELAPVLALYPDLGRVAEVPWHSPRPFAASGIVTCAAGRVFVKRHHRCVRSAADLREEHAFMAHLRAAGAQVPTVLADCNGRTAIEIRDRTYEVHAVSPGLDLYRDHESWSPIHGHGHAREAGRAAGELHRAAAGYAAPPRLTGLLVAEFSLFDRPDPLAAVAERAARQPALAAALAGRPWQADMERVLLPWHAALAPHLRALTPLWTHNDLHASNLLWTSVGAVTTVLDFGMCNRTSAVFDLATTIERNTMGWLFLTEGAIDIGYGALAATLIRGYREAYTLTPEQAAALPHLLPLVHVDFALSELAYFHGITRSASNAELAYTDFLLGHAAWFATAHGKAFVDTLCEALA